VVRKSSRRKNSKMKKHEYCCPICGKNLYELCLGVLVCKDCKTEFLPTCKEIDGITGNPLNNDIIEKTLIWRERCQENK
jgi:ribosomal protein L37AE/L43A